MICFYCGSETDLETEECPFCHANLHAYRVILHTSEAFYNDGLEKASVRDISGAIRSLRESLRYNKHHTNARNLLGLCYFEVGEVVLALREWVISKNLQPDNNIADRYLRELRDTPGMLSKLDQTIKKYNQAIEYCRQGNRDLAKIQLKRVLGMNKQLVAGHQLLALLCIMENDLSEAKKELASANKIDVKNTITLRYMQEVKTMFSEKQASKKRRKKKDEVVTFRDGNESVMMPRRSLNSLRDFVDGSIGGVLNIVIGAIAGVLISVFLLFPTYRQNMVSSNANALVSANEDAAASSNNIAALNQEIEDLNERLSAYEGQDDVATSYDNVLSAFSLYQAGDLEEAHKKLASVNEDLLSDTAKMVYETIENGYNSSKAQAAYDEAYRLYWEKKYEEAAPKLKEVVDLDETTGEGRAVYYLADSYDWLGQYDEAIPYYRKYVELFPDGEYAWECNDRANYLDEHKAELYAADQAAGE